MILSSKACLASLLASVTMLAGCGGSDSEEINVVPTGGTLADVWFADNEGYAVLDKLKPNGAVFALNDPGYGTRNPAFRTGDTTRSAWGIDTSASAPAEYTIEYGMTISAIAADGAALQSMRENLVIDPATGLITQTCRGFPQCYDNTTAAAQDFLISATAKVKGARQPLTRTFILRVRAG